MNNVSKYPLTWKYYKLGELSDLITKGTTPTTNGFQYLGEGINFIKVESIASNGSFIPDMFAYVGNDCHDSFKRSQLKEGDLLFTIAGALGRSAIVIKDILPANTNQAIAIIRLRNKEHIKFIYHFLRGDEIQRLIKKINVSTAQANLNLGQLNKFEILLPPLLEQQKIAEILSTVDEKIDLIDQQIDATQELKKGMMQRLLTKGIGHTEFKDSPLGEIPKGWEVVKLGQLISELIGGVSVNSEDREAKNGELGILKTSALYGGRFYPKKHKTIIKGDIHRAKLNPKKDAILISRMNTPLLVGECAYIEKDHPSLFIPDRIWMTRFSFDYDTHVKWLSYVLSSHKLRNEITTRATGTSNSMKNISKASLLNIKILYPSYNEQKKISNILSSIDSKIDSLLLKKEGYKKIKKGLMQKLLTGRIRVNV